MLRTKQGLTLKELSRRANVCPATINYAENHAVSTKFETFEALVNAMGYDIKLVKRKGLE